MDRLKDKSRRNIKVKNEKISDTERHQKDIIKSLRKANVNEKDIEYIINGLNEINKMIQDKKTSSCVKIDIPTQ